MRVWQSVGLPKGNLGKKAKAQKEKEKGFLKALQARESSPVPHRRPA